MNPRTLADRWLRADLARSASVIVLTLVGALVVAQFATSKGEGTAFGPTLGADYAEFHAVGTLLNEFPANRLYDLNLQDELLHREVPALPASDHLPFAYPPFLAPVFRPLAMLPYRWSFAAWLVVSLAAYAASVALVLRGSTLSGSERLTVWLLALSFEPFAMECWLGGQLSSLGCLAIATALAFRRAGRPLLAGFALAFLLYKPTLPLLIAPLLVVGQRWRMVAGLGIVAIGLALTSLAVVGEAGCLEFVDLMADYSRIGGSTAEGFKTIKYVDLRAFLGLLGFGREATTLGAVVLTLPALAGLVFAWSKGDRGPNSDLAWSAALCWTPVLSPYGPIYDVSIAIPGLLLAASALRTDDGWPKSFRWLIAVGYVAALVSPAQVKGLGFQPLTLALAAMGAYLIREGLRRPCRPTASGAFRSWSFVG